MTQADQHYGRAFIRRTEWRHTPEWELWIPPTQPEHYDEAGNWINQWGTTYFPTFEEARKFYVETHDDVLAGRLPY